MSIDKEKESNDCIVDCARDIIEGRRGLIDGSRAMRSLYLNVSEDEKELFIPIIGFESETDDYPIGSEREKFSAEHLLKMDEKMNEYCNKSSVTLHNVLNDIITYYEKTKSENSASRDDEIQKVSSGI